MDTTTTTTITDFTTTFYFPDQTLTFSYGPSGANGWSQLTLDPSLASVNANGTTYYPYVPPIAAVDGTTYLPQYSFISSQNGGFAGDYYYGASVMLDGKPVVVPEPVHATLPVV